MLINKLKQYPKQSQGGNYLSPSGTTSNTPAPTIQTNLYTSGGEYQLPDGTEYIGAYHIHPTEGAMVGATHVRSSHAKLTAMSGVMSQGGNVNITNLLPNSEYEKYITSGSTYKSNLTYVNSRNQKGNIELVESASNSMLIFEPISNNFTNRSIVSAIDTQFQFFKFPAQVSTTLNDLSFDENLLDIDVQQGILNDPYQGKLIRNKNNKSAGLFLVQGTVKRKFDIRADSIWALKNGLPPFSNINNDIPGKDPGEDNYFSTNAAGEPTGYYGNTFIDVNPGIFNGYTEGDPYNPSNAFAEGDIYGKVYVELSTSDSTFFDSTPTVFITMQGPNFGEITWNGISSAMFDPTNTTAVPGRFTEFDISELQDSYIGITSNMPQTAAVSQDNEGLNKIDGSRWISGGDTNLVTIIDDTFAFDTSDGYSYLSFVEEAFRDWVTGVGSWDITRITPGGSSHPRSYLDGIKSKSQSGQITTWAASGYDYWLPGSTTTELKNNSTGDFTPWYKLSLPLNTVTYQLFLDGQDITGFLRDSSNVPIGQDYSGNIINPVNGTAFQDPTVGVNDYNGLTLNIRDVFPNGLSVNSGQRMDIQINTNGSTSLSIYFIGLAREPDGSNIARDRLSVVPNSITFADPTVGNPAPAGGSSNVANKLKNAYWGVGARTYVQRLWNGTRWIHFGSNQLELNQL